MVSLSCAPARLLQGTARCTLGEQMVRKGREKYELKGEKSETGNSRYRPKTVTSWKITYAATIGKIVSVSRDSETKVGGIGE